MDNAQKAIMIGVGLFITILVISIVLLIVNSGNKLSNEANKNISKTSNVFTDEMGFYSNSMLNKTDIEDFIDKYYNLSMGPGTHDKFLIVIKDYMLDTSQEYKYYRGGNTNINTIYCNDSRLECSLYSIIDYTSKWVYTLSSITELKSKLHDEKVYKASQLKLNDGTVRGMCFMPM